MREDCALGILPLVSFNFERNWTSVRALQGQFLHAVLKQIYTATVSPQLEEHWCSMLTPCIKARPLLADFMSFRLVSHAWNNNWKRLFSATIYFRDPRAFVGNKLPLQTGVSFGLGRFGFYYSLTGEWPWYQCMMGRYRVQHAAQSEDRVSVFFARDHGGPSGCENCSEVALKAYSNDYEDDCLRERNIYERLTKDPMKGVPEISWMGRGRVVRTYFFAMTRLGSTLQGFHDRAPDNKLNDRLLLHIAIQLMDRYKDLHSRQIIHNGVKPGNIAICPPDTKIGTPDRAMIYIFDFGFSQYLRDEPREENITSNHLYASIMTLWECRQSQRDDLESLCYLFTYLFHGTLPWYHERHDREATRYKKMKIQKSELFAGMDPAFGEFWDSVRALAWGEVPDYDGMKERFCRSWREKGYDGEPGTVDWQVMWDELVEADKARKAEEEAKRLSEAAAKEAEKRKADADAMEQPVTADVDSKAEVDPAMKVDGDLTDRTIPKATPQDDRKEVDSVMVPGNDAHMIERRGELERTRVDTNHSAQDGKASAVDTDSSSADACATDHAKNVDMVAPSTKAVAVPNEDATQNASVDRKIGIEGTVDCATPNDVPTEDDMVVDVAPSMLADKETGGITKGSDASVLDKSQSSDLTEAYSEPGGAKQVIKTRNTDSVNGWPDATTHPTDIDVTNEACALVKNDLGDDGKSGDVIVLVVDTMVVDEDGRNTSDAKVDIKDNFSGEDTLVCDQDRQPAMQCATEAEGDSVVDSGNMEVVVCG
ncbi:kinase-like protein [Rickenella mellea]|uniref:Kinase-like protein n=1 Tax=Rickenella mellea TaxID=50990 RepID=A0A4Y7PU32_9AGAM|nr:kinase-like protein [Rickenella mellea]